MTQAASIAAKKFIGFLAAADTGIGPAIAALAADTGVVLAPLPAEHIVNQNIPMALAERSQAVKYPVVHVYSDRVRNVLTEKFRTFSGKVRAVAEIRFSQDRVEGIEERLRLYVDAVTQVLDANRGSWGEGAFYAGAYEVSFDPVQRGGRNFLQIARVSFEVDLSV
jgi:hypothetical protein